MTEDEGRAARLRGRLVEGVRLIFMALIGAVGYQIGSARTDVNEREALLYVFLGAACGYVLGGVFGRLTLEAVSGLERELRRRPAAQIAGGVVGLIVGLVIAALMSIPLFFAAGCLRVAGVGVPVHRARVARDPAGSGQARGHLRVGRA